MADPATAFQWGAGGARLTADEIAQRRKDAATLVQQGTDASPLPVGTRGAGVWTQGLARVAKALSGGLESREADQAAKANASDNKDMIAALLGGGGASAPAAVSAAPAASVPASTAADTSVPRGIRNNNPLNIEDGDFAKSQPGYAGTDGRFAKFETPDHGTAAANTLLDTYQNKYGLNTVGGIVNRWAPAGDGSNDPTAYAASVAKRMGVAPDAALKPEQRSALIAAMGQQENGRPVQVASADPSFVPAAPAAPAAPAPAAVAKVVGALGLSPTTIAGAQYPSPLQSNTGPAVPLQASIPGMPAVAPMTAQAPVRFTGRPGFVPPSSVPAAAPAPAPVATAADDDEEDTPANATPTQGVVPSAAVAKVAAAMPGAAPSAASAAPSVAPVQSGLQNVNPNVLKALTSPYSDDATKKIAGLLLQQQMTPKEVHAQTTDKDGNVYDVNRLTGERKVILKADGDPTSVKEYNFYKSQLPTGAPAMPYDVWSTAKARAAATNVTTNVDTKPSQTYSNTMAGGLAKAHGALANGVEDAQTRARDIAAMQGAIDQIQKNGGTTGGLAPQARLELQKSINAGAAAIGVDKPFSEADISDKEFLTKFNRSMAGAQAKNAVGSRVTNFEMQNFLKANPGLDMTVTGNQRLLGIQAQIEQRNIAVGNAIRQATAQAMAKREDVDPMTVQKIITDYDAAHHISDPTTGQDLTQSYALPEFQNQGNNAALAVGHEANINGIKVQRVK